MMQLTETVKQLLIINIIFFVGTLVLGGPAIDYLALHFPLNPDFKAWQPVSYMFMHGGIMHILFNMLGLVMFGSQLEYMWGAKKFIFFYVSCGLGAAALHLGIEYYVYHDVIDILILNGFNKADILSMVYSKKFNPDWLEFITTQQLGNFMNGFVNPMLGASGALYGVIVAYGCLFPDVQFSPMFLPIGIKARYFVPGLLILDLFLGLKGMSFFGSRWGGGVAHFAHLGGALIGFIIMWSWSRGNFNHNRWN
jgi:membrane associated rhomboid family serine protease